MLSADEYGQFAMEFRQVCEDQRQAGRTAAEFDRFGLPLLAESYHVESQALTARMWELLPLLQEYEAAVRGGRFPSCSASTTATNSTRVEKRG